MTNTTPNIIQYRVGSVSGHGEREYFVVAVTDALPGYDNMDPENVQRVVDQLNAQLKQQKEQS